MAPPKIWESYANSNVRCKGPIRRCYTMQFFVQFVLQCFLQLVPLGTRLRLKAYFYWVIVILKRRKQISQVFLTESFRRLYQVFQLMTHLCKVQKSIPIANGNGLGWEFGCALPKTNSEPGVITLSTPPPQWSHLLRRIPCEQMEENKWKS